MFYNGLVDFKLFIFRGRGFSVCKYKVCFKKSDTVCIIIFSVGEGVYIREIGGKFDKLSVFSL